TRCRARRGGRTSWSASGRCSRRSTARWRPRSQDGCRRAWRSPSIRRGLGEAIGAPRAVATRAGRSGLRDLGEEVLVGLRLAHLAEEDLVARGLVVPEGRQDPADLPDLLELGALEEQLLVTGRRGLHVDGRE